MHVFWCALCVNDSLNDSVMHLVHCLMVIISRVIYNKLQTVYLV